MTPAALRRAAVAPRAPAVESVLSQWLLAGPAQCRDGMHAGAVAGTIAADGRARYVYPEITGYYLHWLAWRAARRGHDRALALRAAAAQAWLARWLAGAELLPTRIHLDGNDADWRNDAQFFFDVAMAIRGLAAAARCGVLVPNGALVERFNDVLRGLIGRDGMFEACVPRPGANALPARWSTRRGAFLAKAAAGVIAAHEDLPRVAADVVAAAEVTFNAALDAAPHPEVHPRLYAHEGALSLPQHPRFAATLPRIAAELDEVLERVRATGSVPESLAAADSGIARTDVLAQALRVGHLLAQHLPARRPYEATLARLREQLERRIEADGGVAFAPNAPAGERNVWAAMFAEQALAMSDAGRSLPAEIGRLLA
jgi:hypothetical protein